MQSKTYISISMLPHTVNGTQGPTIVMLHWLGGSAKTWSETSDLLAGHRLTCIALDLPGFGRAADRADFVTANTIEEMIATIQTLRDNTRAPWLLAGHSMGGKFAAIVARAALNGRQGLENLRGIVLVSPSPPGPEPMQESVRDKMMKSLGKSTREAEKDQAHATDFVQDNVGKLPLGDATQTRTVDDVLRMNREALLAWLTTGSKEDWAERVGTIHIPTLILAGTEEAALGPDAQTSHTLPHFPNATLVALTGSGHLAPIERPFEISARIVAFVQSLRLTADIGSEPLPSSFLNLIDSSRTSLQTREVLKRRLEDDERAALPSLTPEELLTLRSVAASIIPGCSFDLASRVDRWLGQPHHDGWRHDTLPVDLDAWRIGLRSLNAASLDEFHVPFVALDAIRKDKLLTKARDGQLGPRILKVIHLGERHQDLSAAQMSDWFGDMAAELTRIYIADPRTMARIGFSGFADEGGFTRIRLNEREDFEQ